MIITPLWHTEFLVDIESSHDENVRILVDTWLSDFAVGDLMERTVKVKLDITKLSSIDIIYISHAHTDHLDPYTLVEIYHHASPILLIPFTLEYLIPLFREYLGDIQIEILHLAKPFIYKGIELRGHMFEQSTITNEDDVMMLSIANEKELLFAEIDTLPDEYDENVQKSLFRALTYREFETVCYLATRNMLEWQLPLYDTAREKRKSFRDQFVYEQKENIRASYEKFEYDDYTDLPNIFTISGFCRGFIGQGIGYPVSVSHELAQLNIFPLDEIVSFESDVAAKHGYDFSQKALLPGRQYRVEKGQIETGRKECPLGELVFSHTKIGYENLPDRVYAEGPLFPRILTDDEIAEALAEIEKILSTTFLAYWSASPEASFRSALVKNQGTYSLVCHSGETHYVFLYTLVSGKFRRSDTWIGKSDEEYFLLDVLDFLYGRQELYSNFWHKLDTKKVYRLWTFLGANFCNNELVLNKYKLHFERAKRGETSEGYFEMVRKNLQS